MKIKHYLLIITLSIGIVALIGIADQYAFGKLRNQIESKK